MIQDGVDISKLINDLSNSFFLKFPDTMPKIEKVGGDASTPDLQIWHDGSHTRMHHQGTGQFIIYGNDNDQVKLQMVLGLNKQNLTVIHYQHLQRKFFLH